MVVKVQVLFEHAARISRQTTQRMICNKATRNVESNIKFWKFLQRFADFSAERLQTQSFLQSLRPERFKYPFENNRTQAKRSETDAASQKGHHKDKQGFHNNELRSAMHHTTT